MNSCPLCAFVKLPILIATLGSFAVGALWYSPLAFGKMWMRACGITPDPSGKCSGSPRAMIGALLMDYLSVGVLSFFLQFMQIRTWNGGLMIGLITAVGFIFTSQATCSLFEKKPISYMAINVGHRIVALSLAGAILGAWH